jgi:hypothetical protein
LGKCQSAKIRQSIPPAPLFALFFWKSSDFGPILRTSTPLDALFLEIQHKKLDLKTFFRFTFFLSIHIFSSLGSAAMPHF